MQVYYAAPVVTGYSICNSVYRLLALYEQHWVRRPKMPRNGGVNMVQLPGSEDLEQLKNFKEPFCLTIYVPHIEIDPSGATNPNRIELKNLLRQAEIALLDDDVEPRIVKKTLRPARELLDGDEFWPLRSESLALFAYPDLFKYYYLPGDIPYMLTIGSGFNLGPLLTIMRRNRPYLVLALSHKNVQLYEGDRFSLRKLRLKNFPANLKRALNIDEYPKAFENHPIGAGGNRGTEGVHGQYNVRETDKQMLLLFFQLIDRSLRQFLQKKNEPLILAGVEYLLPIYRQANTSPYLLDEAITGNVEHVSWDTLRKRAWSVVSVADRKGVV